MADFSITQTGAELQALLDYTNGMMGRVWTNVNNQRINDKNYTNDTGYTIVVAVESSNADGPSPTMEIIVDENRVAHNSGSPGSVTATVPPGSTYRFIAQDIFSRIWLELR